ncbi:PREDICTED: longitudinals lacking protein, isoforms H/M/V-like [Papilio xuthus]|uniref:Longitudinals lacking protein, isoforms H/M/V-like n=1 Tax=Papilio xuthus TaxID=66420 RepID=A0AAJ7EKM1_PAPXU|nr:PREDICTED: longitudinals lacking protein, isoforms H/M/V-like [Papilio xuthus]
MANQEISLKWNGYQSNILSNVKELYKDEGLSDVTLVTEGHSFKAHKVILSANSSVFKTIFQQNPHKDPIIVLHDINTASLQTLLTFMYNGEVNVTEDFLPVLLKTAETLRICGLSTGSESREDDKISASHSKKRKKSEIEDNNNKPKKPHTTQYKSDVATNVINADSLKNTAIVPKVEPVDSPLTDYSGENTNDTDIALLEDVEKKYSISPESSSGKSMSSVVQKDRSVKKWINEVSSTQPCLNVVDKTNGIDIDEDKDSVEIDKEVENVLQSGTIVESLSITTDSLNSVSSEVQNIKDKTNTCYANPSFPCPFCPRVYNSWGYRRRHVKSRHVTNRLSCKWCISVLPSTGAWYSHATKTHGVPHEEARNSLVVMVEAHAVLTLNEPSVTQLLGQVGITDSNGSVANEKTN